MDIAYRNTQLNTDDSEIQTVYNASAKFVHVFVLKVPKRSISLFKMQVNATGVQGMTIHINWDICYKVNNFMSDVS